MPSGETERVFFLVQNIQFSAGRANLLNWEGVGSDGRYRGTVSFSDLGCSVGSGERGGGGGGAPEGRRESCQNCWLKACTFLARGESLWMKKSQEAAGRVAFSLPTCL